MKHWYITGPEKLEVVDEDIPIPAAGEVLVRIAYTALSPGSNLHAYRTGTYATQWEPGNVEALYMGSGVIESVGAGVDDRRIGQRVAFNGAGHQEYAVLSADRVYRIPDKLSLDVASLAYLSAWSVSALHLGGYAAAETVAVVGLGLVGASAAVTADVAGARVLGLDVESGRIDYARGLGLGCVEDPRTLKSGGDADRFLGTSGPDLIIETSGSWSGFRTALGLARDYSRIALMGIYRDPPPEDLLGVLHQDLFGFPSKMHYQRVQIVGCGSDPDAFSEPVSRNATRSSNFQWVLEQAARGRLNLNALVTHRLPADAIESALIDMMRGERSMIGVVFDWGWSAGERKQDV